MKLGWRKDRIDERDQVFATVTQKPASVAVLRFDPSKIVIRDQGDTSSCVAHSLHYALQARSMLLGLQRVNVSRLWLYWAARARHGESAIDEGTYLRDGNKVLAKLGVCPERDWPFDPGKVNDQPSWEAFQRAFDQRAPLAYRRIVSLGEKRTAAVRESLAKGFPVVFGTPVTERFCQSTKEAVFDRPKPTSKLAGGHAMCLLGYRDEVFFGPQSWGETWGGDGWFRLTEDYLLWEQTEDLWSIEFGH